MKRTNGLIDVPGGKVWYQIVGSHQNTPLIVLHGGPGYPHDYLQPLEDLASDRPVIFYDQLGCGNSEWATSYSLWTVKRFVMELKEIIKALGLKKYHLLGHSWGSALAVAFALKKPEGLVSMILSDPYISTPRWEQDASRLIQELPKGMQQALAKRDTDSKAYKQAADEFYDRFVQRLKPMPKIFAQAAQKKNNDIYNYMWGPEEFFVTGTLKNFDPSARLAEITVPVLLLCGRFDEATPESTQYFQSLFPNAKLQVFEDSAHYPFWNEKSAYMHTIQDFLKITHGA